MYPLFFAGEITLVWLSALFNGTGLGSAYHTDQITLAVLFILSSRLFLKQRIHRIPTDIFWSFCGMLIIFTLSSLLHGCGWSAVRYFSCFLLIYLVSNAAISAKMMHLAGLAVLFLGTAILAIYDFGTQLSGWNGNSIAMIGIFSYLIFSAAFWDENMRKRRWLLLLTGAVEFRLISPTGSRSCQVVLLIMVVLVLIRPTVKLLCSRWWIVVVLLIPLVIAVISALLSDGGLASKMELWSYQTFGKSIFNGRDTLWKMGFQQLWERPLLGNGNIDTLRWHNSAVSCLVSFGAVGYVFWLSGLYALVKRGKQYLEDSIIRGCLISFLLIYLQQGVELGMLTKNPNLLIYLPLGLMLGRINYLKGCCE